MMVKKLLQSTREQFLQMPEEMQKDIWRHLTAHVEAIADYKQPEQDAFYTLMAAFGECPVELQKAAWEKEVYYPASLYYHAPEEIAEGLSNRILQTPPTESLPQPAILLCLAMQGGKTALSTFLKLNTYPDEWKKRLSPYYHEIILQLYAQSGGWSFTQDGTRQELQYASCVPLIRSDRQEPVVQTMRIRKDLCPKCGEPYYTILSLDGSDTRLSFLGIEGKVSICCCMECACYEPSFSRYTLDGDCAPILPEENLDPQNMEQDEADVFENVNYILGEAPVPIFYGAEDWEKSSIGGFPHWIDDAYFVDCPDCSNPMKYLAQLSLDDYEGTFYIEICPHCRTAAVIYQQT